MEEETNDEAIANFCAVTGADENTAKHFLAASNGDLDSAVSLFLDGGSAGGIGSGENIASTATSNPNNRKFDEEEVRAPIQAKRAVLVDETDSYSSNAYPRAPPPMTTFTPVEPFRDFRAEASPFLGGNPADERGRRLAELFRPPTEIIFPGAFEAARVKAKQEARWLLVTVHNPTDFSCQMMIRDVWNDTAIQEFVRESLIFVFLTMGTSEAERYGQYYPIEGFPHWALIDPRTGMRVKVGATKAIKGAEMLMTLVDYVFDHPLMTTRSKGASPIDTDKPNDSTINDLSPSSTTTTTSSPLACPINNKRPLESSEETVKIPPEPELNDPAAITIQFRLSDGKRLRRRFLVSDEVKLMFEYIKSVEGETISDDFDLMQNRDKFYRKREKDRLDEHDLKNASLVVVLPDK